MAIAESQGSSSSNTGKGKNDKGNERTNQSQDNRATRVDHDDWHKPIWVLSPTTRAIVSTDGKLFAGWLDVNGWRVWNKTHTNIIGRFHEDYMTITRIPQGVPDEGYPYPESKQEAETMNVSGKHNWI